MGESWGDRNSLVCWPVVRSHTRTVRSSPIVAALSDAGSRAARRMRPVCERATVVYLAGPNVGFD